MSQHTAGPWRIERRTAKPVPSNRPLRLIAIGPMEPSGSYVQSPAVTIVYLDNFLDGISGGFRDDESEANARLIAAAPELLEACRSLIHAKHFRRERLGDGGVNVDFHAEALFPILDAARAAVAAATGGVS